MDIIISRLKYWNRIISAYLLKKNSQLSFWHGKPEINDGFDKNFPKSYFMKFHYKAFTKELLMKMEFHCWITMVLLVSNITP